MVDGLLIKQIVREFFHTSLRKTKLLWWYKGEQEPLRLAV